MGEVLSYLLMGMAAMAFAGLLFQKIPSLFYMMVFFTIYYNAQIGICHFLFPDFVASYAISPYAKNPQFALEQLVLILSSLAAMGMGTLVYRPSRFRTTVLITESSSVKLFFMGGGLLVICTALLIILGRQGFFEAYDAPDPYKLPSPALVLFLTLVKILGVVMVAAGGYYIATKKKILLLLLALSIGFFVLSAIKSGKRLEVTMTVFASLLTFYILYLKVWVRLLGIVIFMSLLTYIGLTRVGADVNSTTVTIVPFLEGFYSNHSFTGYFTIGQSNALEKTYFLQYLQSAGAFIPRFIWPSKEEVLYKGYGDISKEVAPLGGGSLMSDFYLQGGAAWVILSYFVLGWLLAALQARTADYEFITLHRRFSYKVMFYTIMASFFMIHMRDGFITSVKNLLQLSLAAYLVLLALKNYQWTSKAQTPNQ